MGRSDRILCLIVDGEPNVSDKPDSPGRECFPPSMRFSLKDNGTLSEERVEPRAADARPGMDGKRDALLKLAAGLLGVNFDQLKQREQERRIRRLTLMGVMAATLLLTMMGLALYAMVQRMVAQEQLDLNRRRLALTYVDKAQGRLDINDPAAALP